MLFHVLPFGQVFPAPPATPAPSHFLTDPALLALLAALGFVLVFLLVRRSRPRGRRQAARKARPAQRQARSGGAQTTGLPVILIDGSNVMHWKNETPDLGPVRAAVAELAARGFDPGVVFDANAGWKLHGRFLHEGDFAGLLDLPRDRIFVAPKGTPADHWLLEAARDHGARIVTRDRISRLGGGFSRSVDARPPCPRRLPRHRRLLAG